MSKFTHPKCQQHKIGITILAFFSSSFFQTREGIFCHLFFVDSLASSSFFHFFLLHEKALKGGANCLWHKRGGNCCKRMMRLKKGREESFLRIPPSLYSKNLQLSLPFYFLSVFHFLSPKT